MPWHETLNEATINSSYILRIIHIHSHITYADDKVALNLPRDKQNQPLINAVTYIFSLYCAVKSSTKQIQSYPHPTL
jgi:hypothetical protein